MIEPGCEQQLETLFREKANAGDGRFAIAWALVHLAATHNQVALALDRLGINEMPGNPDRLGTTQKIATELEFLREKLCSLPEKA